jgi:hypothetical protein
MLAALGCGQTGRRILATEAQEPHITRVAAVRPYKQDAIEEAFEKSSSIPAPHARAVALRAFLNFFGEQESHWHPREPLSVARRFQGFNEREFLRFEIDRRVTQKLRYRAAEAQRS